MPYLCALPTWSRQCHRISGARNPVVPPLSTFLRSLDRSPFSLSRALSSDALSSMAVERLSWPLLLVALLLVVPRWLGFPFLEFKPRGFSLRDCFRRALLVLCVARASDRHFHFSAGSARPKSIRSPKGGRGGGGVRGE